MEHYCRQCGTTRTFNLKRDGSLERIYECSYCSVQVEEKTLMGWVAAVGGTVATVAGVLWGISHKPHKPS